MKLPKATVNVFKVIAGVLLCYVVLYTMWNGKRLLYEDATKEDYQQKMIEKLMEHDRTVATDGNEAAAIFRAAKGNRAAAMDKLTLFMIRKTRSVDDPRTPLKDENGHEMNLTVDEYKKLKAKQYMKLHANPPQKTEVPPTLQPYGPDIERRDPRAQVKDESTELHVREIEEALKAEKKRRMDLGDDDILKIPEVKEEIEKNPTGVPNIIHFVWYSCHAFKVHHFISMMSAAVIQKPRIILLHTNCVPEGDYWDAFFEEAGLMLKIVKRSPPVEVWGRKIRVVEHQSDVSRLQLLLESGGIYLDCDTVVLKSLDPLRKHEMVLGEVLPYALSNGIMLGNRNAWFLKKWFQEYKNFDDSQWGDSSVLLPWSIWRIFPSKIHVVKEKMLRPNFLEVNYIYQQLFDWSTNYSIHLYARYMQKSDGTAERSLMDLAILNSTYGEITRHVLWGDKKIRDISFLM